MQTLGRENSKRKFLWETGMGGRCGATAVIEGATGPAQQRWEWRGPAGRESRWPLRALWGSAGFRSRQPYHITGRGAPLQPDRSTRCSHGGRGITHPLPTQLQPAAQAVKEGQPASAAACPAQESPQLQSAASSWLGNSPGGGRLLPQQEARGRRRRLRRTGGPVAR